MGAARRSHYCVARPHQKLMAEVHPISPRNFTLIPFNDIFYPRDINYVVRGLIPREGLVLVYGPPKCGKSFWVMDLVLHVALNWNYRGRKVRSGNVVYIACEGVSGVMARIEAFRQNLLQDNPGHIPFYLIPDRLNLRDQHKQLEQDISSIIKQSPLHVIVIDTLNRSLVGDENNSQDMGKYIAAADYLREKFKCAVIIIHHSGYDSTHARGHTSLPAAIDAQISVSSDKETKIITSHLEFMKDGDTDVKIYSSLKQVEIGLDDEGDSITSCIVIKEDETERDPKDELSNQQRIALQSLQQALLERGQSPPDELKLASWIRVVSLEDWRAYFYQNIMVSSSKADAKRQALHRATEHLTKKKLIKFKSDYIWMP